MRNRNIIVSISIILISVLFFGCNNSSKITETTTAPVITEEVLTDIMNSTPVPLNLSTDELITKALLKHYNEQFGNTDAPYKTTGYKMYLVEDVSPREKRAYGFANYMEYTIENGELNNTAGSGPTGIIITFSTNGEDSNVDYEILTDSDYKSEKFKTMFPESVQEKILKRDQKDIDEVIGKQEEMLKELMK